MRTLFLVFVFLVLLRGELLSQTAPSEGPITPASFSTFESSLIQENTGAVVLSDLGDIKVGRSDWLWFAVRFKQKKRIRILSKKAFDLATVSIYVYGTDKLDSLIASTYNLEDGQVKEISLSRKDLFHEKLGTGIERISFTFPAVQEGSIVEYSFVLTSDRVSMLPDWQFQHRDIPCLYSRLRLATPEVLRYLITTRGIDSITSEEGDRVDEIAKMGWEKVTTRMRHQTWTARNIPPFGEWPFIHSPSDYLDRIEFFLVQAYGGEEDKSRMNWQSVNNDLMSIRSFGRAFLAEQNDYLRPVVEKQTALSNAPLESAKMLYTYVRDNFVCTGNDGPFISRDLFDINKSKKGSVAELNLLLTGLLRVKGLKADVILLGTRDYGAHQAEYPLLSKMNYVVVRLQMFGENILLDASDHLMGFGKIPLDCFNGHARIISDKDTGNIFLYADSLHEMNNTTVFVQNGDKGMEGSYQSTLGYYASVELRKKVEAKGLEKYLRDFHGNSVSDYLFSNEGIDSLGQKDMPASLRFDFAVREKEEPLNGHLYFSPVLVPAFKSNPFTAAERRYPVELEKPIDELYVLSMEIPSGYAVEEIPASAKVLFSGADGVFDYAVRANSEGIQLRMRIQLNRTMFGPEEYKDLRAFFALIIKKQSEQIVFKKLKPNPTK